MGESGLLVLVLFLTAKTVCPSTTPNPLTYQVAFSVSDIQSFVGFESPFIFALTSMEDGIGFDDTVDTLTLLEDGYYFFTLSTGIPAGATVNLQIQGDVRPVNILRDSTRPNGTDTTYRDVILPLTTNQQAFVRNAVASNTYADLGRQTSFSGFNVKAYMSSATAQAFCLANIANTDVTSSMDVSFSDVLLDQGNGFDSGSRARMRINQNGTYFLSLSSGLAANTGLRVDIFSANKGSIGELLRASDNHNGPDTFAKSLMVDLQEGDYVSARAYAGTLYSDAFLQTSLSGFNYDPTSGQKAAWSVYTTQQVIVGLTALDPVTFSGSYMDTPGLYDFTTNSVTIMTAGSYYVQMNVGAMGYSAVDVRLMNAGTMLASVQRYSTSHNKQDTLGRAIMLDLNAGDVLTLTAQPNTAIYSDFDRQTSFTGFLLRPTIADRGDW